MPSRKGISHFHLILWENSHTPHFCPCYCLGGSVLGMVAAFFHLPDQIRASAAALLLMHLLPLLLMHHHIFFASCNIQHLLCLSTIILYLYFTHSHICSRTPRTEERNGVDYTFLSKDEFLALEKSGDLLESGVYDGECRLCQIICYIFRTTYMCDIIASMYNGG